MSHSSRESNLAQLREMLAQLNSEFFLLLGERRGICLKIQELKEDKGRYAHYSPDRENDLFSQMQEELKLLSIKELLSFSLMMEDHAMAMAPGSYPSWSSRCHLIGSHQDLFEMINPLLLKKTHPHLFSRLTLSSEFDFLKEF